MHLGLLLLFYWRQGSIHVLPRGADGFWQACSCHFLEFPSELVSQGNPDAFWKFLDGVLDAHELETDKGKCFLS